jgi:hypothetical protein
MSTALLLLGSSFQAPLSSGLALVFLTGNRD